LAQGADMVLFGKPVIFGDDIPQVASGANAIVLADFYKAYTIVDRFGIRVLRDDVTQKGFIKFYTTVRVGGDVTSWDGLKVYQIS
jgi:HK97 family phage major capsid protein